MELLDHAISSTKEYIAHMPKSLRKKYGQFFTSKESAVFMASLFDIPDLSHISILDPGSGSGILSIALIERLQKEDKIKTIELTCYENDENIIELLCSNMKWVKTHSKQTVLISIIHSNYILSQEAEYNGLLFSNPNPVKYDLIIGNPPYMKIPKDAHEVSVMQDVCYGAPNLYFLFAAMSLFNLKEQGEMVYIIPRSWTSGAYFKKFRKKLLYEGALEHIHLFVSREKIFDNENVLQETIIIKMKKTYVKPDTVSITTSQNNSDFSEITSFQAQYSDVVKGDDCYVYLISNKDEIEALNTINQWKDTLPSVGLRMKTGLTVDFRNRESLRNVKEEKAVPLFFSQHIQNGKVVFPIGKDHEYIVTEQKGLLQNNTNYLFVKRFTAKEEQRRLQCGVYLSRKYPEYKQISTQNKINFICGLHELSDCIVYGLYVIFNSSLYDLYYRVLNGSTQVNSTEINSMPIPPIKTIESMGKELLQSRDMSVASCDKIIRSYT